MIWRPWTLLVDVDALAVWVTVLLNSMSLNESTGRVGLSPGVRAERRQELLRR
jgi:hypothetical protein